VAPVTLPWAPEFEPAPAREGQERLLSVAKAGGGVERLAMAGLFVEALESEGAIPLAPWLLALCVPLLVAEIFTRRFFSGPRLRRPKPNSLSRGESAGARGAASPPPPTEVATTPEAPAPPPPPPPKVDPLALARERAKKRTGR
jgi:hypothetical protein